MSLNTENFSRPEMKARAKSALKGNWRPTLIVILIYFICAGVFSQVSAYFTEDSMADVGIAIVALIVSIVGGLLVNGVLSYSVMKFFVRMNDQETVAFGDFVEGFAEAGRAIVGYLWQCIFIILWCLVLTPASIAMGIGAASGSDALAIAGVVLFIVSFVFVIVRVIRYTFQFMIMADAPDVKGRDALTYSVAITQGHVWDLIKLDISFFFWGLLTLITFGLASFYVVPYIYETNVQAYRWMRDEAFRQGRLDSALLGYKRNSAV